MSEGCATVILLEKGVAMCEDYPCCGHDQGDCPEIEDNFSEDESWFDGDALASVGWGTDEDYGFYGEDN
jgi:hypothetical protein